MAQARLAQVRMYFEQDDEGNFFPVSEPKDDEHEKITRDVYLLHWGVDWKWERDADDKYHVVQYTVAICRDKLSGRIWKFDPVDLRIIGTETLKT